jgi:polysaccharide biosynthesis/export protein
MRVSRKVRRLLLLLNAAILIAVFWVFSLESLAQSGSALGISTPAPASDVASSVAGPPRNSVMPTPSDSGIRLGEGDLIEVSVYDVPELNTKTRVNDAGQIYLPLVNYVQVEGLTVSDAERVIEKRLEDGGFVRTPHVQILVHESTTDTVSVLGEVAKPGVYPVLGGQSLFSVISAAGGLSDKAGKSISITRRSQSAPVAVPISHNLEDHPDSNVQVFGGDTIMVRRADVVYVVGEVNHASGFLMDNNHLTVLQAIAMAGGTGPNAKLDGARILRKGPEGISEVPVPLKKLLQAKVSDMPLQAEDILFVPASARKILGSRGTEAILQMATAASIVAIR